MITSVCFFILFSKAIKLPTSNNKLYDLVAVPGKGVCCIAKTNIEVGTLIIEGSSSSKL